MLYENKTPYLRSLINIINRNIVDLCSHSPNNKGP